MMHAYIVLSLLAGIRTEEARALGWAHVDLDGDPAARPAVPPHVAVRRSVRTRGETKTERSRRTLAHPQLAVQAHVWLLTLPSIGQTPAPVDADYLGDRAAGPDGRPRSRLPFTVSLRV